VTISSFKSFAKKSTASIATGVIKKAIGSVSQTNIEVKPTTVGTTRN